jgi:hypothetical protein
VCLTRHPGPLEAAAHDWDDNALLTVGHRTQREALAQLGTHAVEQRHCWRNRGILGPYECCDGGKDRDWLKETHG